MNTLQDNISKAPLRLLSILLVIVIAFVLLPEGKTASLTQLDDAILEDKAIAVARDWGLIGEPIQKKAVHMSLGEWNKLEGSGGLGKDAHKIGLTPEMPVFVLVIRGNVIWKGPSGIAWWGGEPEHFDNITIVLDAYTGRPMYMGSRRSGAPLPVEIP